MLKFQNYSPITAKLVAEFIMKAGADQLITMDLHTPQIEVCLFNSYKKKQV